MDATVRQELEVDQFSLELNWQEQSNLYCKYVGDYAELVAEKDLLLTDLKDLKDELKITEAELELDVRQFPEKYGLKKITDASVSAVVSIQRTRKEVLLKISVLQREIIKIEKKINNLETIKAALLDRRKALEGLTTLFVNNYYSDNPQDALSKRGNASRLKGTDK
jgi:hypothetical protein